MNTAEYAERATMVQNEISRLNGELKQLAETIAQLRAEISGVSSAADDLDSLELGVKADQLLATLENVLTNS